MTSLPYFFVPEEGEVGPLVVSVPHAGTRVPAVDRPLIVADERTLLRDADLLVDHLYRNAPTLGAALLVNTISRYVLDVNRAPDDVDTATCPEVPLPGPPNPRALIWRLSTDGAAVMPRPLSRAELTGRIERVHTPYHTRLRALLDERRARFGYAILLDAHSMPSVGRATHSDPGRPRADVVPGDNKGKSCAPELTRLVVEHFQSAGLSVSLNDPYFGGWITRHYGRPGDGVHAIQVELNRRLYLHEDTPAFAGAAAFGLMPVLEALVSRLRAFCP